MSSPSTKRPGPLPKSGPSRHHHGNDHHQHSKSWTARLYRKHDAKHHRREDAPLLADDNAEEPAPSEAESEPEEEPRRCRDCCSGASKGTIDFIKGAGNRFKNALANIGEAAKSAGNAIASGAKKGGSSVKNNPKKVMGVTIGVLAVAVAGLTTAVMIDKIQHKHQVDICTTPACVRASNFILRNLDPRLTAQESAQVLNYHTVAVDPCVDFDQFACGGFGQQYDLREDQGDMYTGTLVADHAESLFKRIVMLDDSKVPNNDLAILKMLKKAYFACMDHTQARESGLKPLEALVDHIKELLPTSQYGRSGARRLDQSTITTLGRVEGLDKVFVFLKTTGIDTLVKMDVIPDPKEPSTQTVALSPVLAIGLPAPDNYRDAALVEEYRDVATETLKVFYDVHLNSSSILRRHQNIHSSVLDIAEGVIDLEVKLALALPLPEDLSNIEKTYSKISIGKLEAILPQIGIETVIKDLAPGVHPTSAIAASPEYLERLSFVLGGTPIEILQAFMSWKVIHKLAEEIDHPKLKRLNQFQAKLKGSAQELPAEPWRQCVREVNEILGWVMSRFFVKQKYTDPKGSAANVIADRVKKAFVDMLDEAHWMTKDDRAHAITKALAMTHKIGYPGKHPDIQSPSSIEKYYRKLNISDLHFANKLEFAKFETERIWSKLGSTTAYDEWQMYSTAVNSYYDHVANEMVLPAALLQPPLFYDDSVPEYLSYGSLGSIAGHEMSHGFGPVGSHFDKDGKLRDWWSDKTRAAFDVKAQCFAQQYSDFTVKGPNKEYQVNGNLTLSENIADAVGVHAAYIAWQQAEKEQSSKKLPGLDKFTKQQLFWIAYGGRWCSKTTPEKAAERVLTDKHAPKPARILGTIANTQEFLDAFNCPAKEPTCEMF